MVDDWLFFNGVQAHHSHTGGVDQGSSDSLRSIDLHVTITFVLVTLPHMHLLQIHYSA